MSGREAGTESARRVADVLLCFTTTRGSLGVTEIARETNLSAAVTHRILQSLASRDLVSWNPKRRDYELGAAALSLGARKLADLDLRAIARPTLEWLSARSGETATLSALTGRRRVYLDQVLSAHEVRMSIEVGQSFPLHSGSSSRAILAFLPEETVSHVLADRGEDVDADAVRAKLHKVHENGVAVSHEERVMGIASTAAPLFLPGGSPVGAVSVCMPIHRFTDEHVQICAALVKQAAARISEALSGTDTNGNEA